MLNCASLKLHCAIFAEKLFSLLLGTLKYGGHVSNQKSLSQGEYACFRESSVSEEMLLGVIKLLIESPKEIQNSS